MANDLMFPKILVVSLPDARERRRHMQEQLGRFPGLQWFFFDATRIRARDEYPEDYDVRARKFLFGDDLRPGEVGCFLSHRELWRLCAQSGDQAWCILEDDIVLLDNFEQRVRLLMRHVSRWDVVRLMQLLPRRGSWIHQELDPQNRLRGFDRQPSGMQGYLIRPQAAKILFQHAHKIVWPIDETLDLYWEHKQRLYCLDPPAIGLDQRFESMIGARSSARRPKWRKLQRQIINGIHGVKRKLYVIRQQGLRENVFR